MFEIYKVERDTESKEFVAMFLGIDRAMEYIRTHQDSISDRYGFIFLYAE